MKIKTEAQELAQIRLAERGCLKKQGIVYSADELIRKAIDTHGDKLVVSWSGGRCSTVLLHMVRKLKPDVKVMFTNTGVEYPETVGFVKEQAKELNLNVTITTPEKTFWEIVEKHGFPKPRKPMSPDGRDSSIRTPKCCYWLKEKPMCKFAKENGVEAFITGMRAGEARIRALMTWRQGQFYFHKKFKVWKYNPLILWPTRDLITYVQIHKVPISPLYEKLDRSGCWPCTAFIGWQKQLAQTNFKLYKFMMERMGEQRLLDHFYETRVAPCSDRG